MEEDEECWKKATKEVLFLEVEDEMSRGKVAQFEKNNIRFERKIA